MRLVTCLLIAMLEWLYLVTRNEKVTRSKLGATPGEYQKFKIKKLSGSEEKAVGGLVASGGQI